MRLDVYAVWIELLTLHAIKRKSMKKFLFIAFLLLGHIGFAMAQKSNVAEIKFDTTVHDFGTFSENESTQKCVFTFTNVGSAPLVINQAVGSCGCTIPQYTKAPIRPGEKGEIKVTYKGKGLYPGHFKKTVTVRTNGDPSMVRLYIEGTMTDANAEAK